MKLNFRSMVIVLVVGCGAVQIASAGAPAERAPLSDADMKFLAELEARLTIWREHAASGSGHYPATREQNRSLPTHMIYRPQDLGALKFRLPIILFGNGGCRNTSIEYTELLAEIASHGYIVIAVGRNDVDYATTDLDESARSANGLPVQILDPQILTRGLDWILKENLRVGSPYFRKVQASEVAYMGQSCGGVQALTASADPRTRTTVVLNSGYFDASTYEGDFKMPPRVEWSALHAPIAFFIGGPDDIAYKAAAANFDAIRALPVFEGNLPVGHLGGHYPVPDPRWTRAIVAWLDWQLKGQLSAKSYFVGPHATLKDAGWIVKSKNLQ